METYKYINYLYDGSFYGLLTVIYEIYYSHSIPASINFYAQSSELQENFLTESNLIITNLEEAKKVYNSILKNISSESLDNIYYAYLSSIEGKELAIYNYIKLGFKIGKAIDSHLYTSEVSVLHKIASKVTHEAHIMTGFIRFTYFNNFYYAIYEPDHNISELIAPHFANRFADQYFIIHDTRRSIAVIYNTKEWSLTSFSESEFQSLKANNTSLVSDNDICYEKLWKEYFENIAVKERKNEKQQKMHMPKRYWKNMLETNS